MISLTDLCERDPAHSVSLLQGHQSGGVRRLGAETPDRQRLDGEPRRGFGRGVRRDREKPYGMEIRVKIISLGMRDRYIGPVTVCLDDYFFF